MAIGNDPLSDHARSVCSQHHGIPGLVKDHPEPTVLVNDKDAAARGIRSGDVGEQARNSIQTSATASVGSGVGSSSSSQ